VKRRDAWTAKADPRQSKSPAVKKRVEVVPAPILAAPKGQAPTVAERGPLADDLITLLPPLDPAARQRLVDALADVALAQLDDAGSTPDVGKE